MVRQSAPHEPELADDDRVLDHAAGLADGEEGEARVGGDRRRRRGHRGGGVERRCVREVLEASVVAAGFATGPLGSRRDDADECEQEQFHA